MGDFFNPEKGVWAALSTMVDVCGLSILWLFLCLPVVTIGPATAALYHTAAVCIRKGETVGIIGTNGAGNPRFLKLFPARLRPPAESCGSTKTRYRY